MAKANFKPMRGVREKPKGSGVWWINIEFNGVRHRECIGSYNVAVQAYIQRRQEIRDGRFIPPKWAAVSSSACWSKRPSRI
jgi:hypothetical protein